MQRTATEPGPCPRQAWPTVATIPSPTPPVTGHDGGITHDLRHSHDAGCCSRRSMAASGKAAPRSRVTARKQLEPSPTRRAGASEPRGATEPRPPATWPLHVGRTHTPVTRDPQRLGRSGPGYQGRPQGAGDHLSPGSPVGSTEVDHLVGSIFDPGADSAINLPPAVRRTHYSLLKTLTPWRFLSSRVPRCIPDATATAPAALVTRREVAEVVAFSQAGPTFVAPSWR